MIQVHGIEMTEEERKAIEEFLQVRREVRQAVFKALLIEGINTTYKHTLELKGKAFTTEELEAFKKEWAKNVCANPTWEEIIPEHEPRVFGNLGEYNEHMRKAFDKRLEGARLEDLKISHHPHILPKHFGTFKK